MVARNWKHPNVHQRDEWINKLYMPKTENCAAIKSNELPILATTWINLRNLKLSEGSQTPEYKL